MIPTSGVIDLGNPFMWHQNYLWFQVNQITSYLDGSNVYGSDASESRKLRLGRGGRLRVTKYRKGELLPLNPDECSDNKKNHYCFAAGKRLHFNFWSLGILQSWVNPTTTISTFPWSISEFHIRFYSESIKKLLILYESRNNFFRFRVFFGFTWIFSHSLTDIIK